MVRKHPSHGALQYEKTPGVPAPDARASELRKQCQLRHQRYKKPPTHKRASLAHTRATTSTDTKTTRTGSVRRVEPKQRKRAASTIAANDTRRASALSGLWRRNSHGDDHRTGRCDTPPVRARRRPEPPDTRLKQETMTRYTRETIASALNPELPRQIGLLCIIVGSVSVPAAYWYGLPPVDAVMLSLAQVYLLCIVLALAFDFGEPEGGR